MRQEGGREREGGAGRDGGREREGGGEGETDMDAFDGPHVGEALKSQ